MLSGLSEASAVTLSQKALRMEDFFELLHSSKLYFMVLLTGMRQKIDLNIVNISPFHSIGASPEGVA